MKYQIQFWPSGATIKAEEGSSLLEAARRAGYSLQTECGGQGTCRRCKVRLIEGDVYAAGKPNLTAAEQKKNLVLACLSRIRGPLKVEVPSRSEFVFSREALPQEYSPGEHPGVDLVVRGLTIEPPVEWVQLTVPLPTLQDNSSDCERLLRALKKTGRRGSGRVPLEILRKLSSTLRQAEGQISILLQSQGDDFDILDVTESSQRSCLGLAIDVGTTTIVARLLDLSTGEVMAEASDFNRQIPCGGDVIHRIIYASKPGGLAELQRLVLENCTEAIQIIIGASGTRREQVVAAMIAGNTTMQHLFLGLDPSTIREEPYVPTITHFSPFQAKEVGLAIHPSAPVYFTPSVASYVGGDITAGLLAAHVHRSDKLCLYVDLGTNGEVALGNREWLTACACSAGPAFEGSGVRCGMRALPGAVDRITRDEKGHLVLHIKGGSSPRGICGSGMIDLLAELRATNRINARGKLQPETDPQRIRATGRRKEFLLVSAAETEGAGDLAISETDLDNLIRTKGAIYAGIMTLLKGVGLEAQSIERVILAGSFGRYLNIENAIRIGMLPDLPRQRFEYIGNGSLRGAGLALLSRQARAELDEISHQITYFELSTWPGYMDEFMAALFLPHTDASLFPTIQSPRT